MNPRPIDPQRWTPPRAGIFRSSKVQLDRVIRLPGKGPEDVLVRPDGKVWTGIGDGRVLSIDPATGRVEEITNTGGRPLGLENHPDGGVVICDCQRGLLYLDPDLSLTVLVDHVDGVKLLATNNASVAADGTIWFTDSSQHFEVPQYQGDLIEHHPTGRVLRRDPDGSVSVVMSGLAFANGVALLPDESAVIIAETGGYAMQRLDLETGEVSDFGPVLPGFPDNLSLGTDGLIWLAIASPRNGFLDFLFPKAPILRKVLWSLPERMLPSAASLIHVQAYDSQGRLVHDLLGEHPDFGMVTGVRRDDGLIWLGSLESTAVGAIAL